MFSCKLNVMHKNAKYSPLLLLLVSFDHLLVCAGAGLLQCKTRWVCASNSLDSVQLSPLLPLSLYLSLPLHLTFTLSINKLKNYFIDTEYQIVLFFRNLLCLFYISMYPHLSLHSQWCSSLSEVLPFLTSHFCFYHYYSLSSCSSQVFALLHLKLLKYCWAGM